MNITSMNIYIYIDLPSGNNLFWPFRLLARLSRKKSWLSGFELLAVAAFGDDPPTVSTKTEHGQEVCVQHRRISFRSIAKRKLNLKGNAEKLKTRIMLISDNIGTCLALFINVLPNMTQIWGKMSSTAKNVTYEFYPSEGCRKQMVTWFRKPWIPWIVWNPDLGVSQVTGDPQITMGFNTKMI